MRTTLTLDEDVAQAIERLRRERGGSFKGVVNELLRRGLRADGAPEPYVPPVFASGTRPGVDLDKALLLVSELDDAEVVRKIETGT